MLKVLQLTICFLLIILFSGCLQPYQIKFDPQLNISPSGLNSDKTVYLKVLDERPFENFGRANSLAYGLVNHSQNIAEVIFKKVSEGLNEKGFKVSQNPSPNFNNLRVEIRNIEYFPIHNARTGFKITCKNPRKDYKNFYQAADSTSGKTIEENINGIVAEALGNMLNDDKLLLCLQEG